MNPCSANLEFLFQAIAVVAALLALYWQKREITKNGKVIALIHAATMIQDKIDLYEKIIADMKRQHKPWEGLAGIVNDELRPLKERLDMEFINAVTTYSGLLHEKKVRDAIKSKTP